MIARFADSGYYAALANAHDNYHKRAVAALASYSGRVITTEFVLVEAANFYNKPAARSAFLDLLAKIRTDPDTEIISASSVLFQSGRTIFAARPDKEWSLTDCISFCVMNDRGLIDALTADQHFVQAGFNALLT